MLQLTWTLKDCQFVEVSFSRHGIFRYLVRSQGLLDRSFFVASEGFQC
uniref:Uncharacterized protein n=1 Tax=Tetraselmis sp. GSL018 TaxID=582737 RepID=A0A061SGG7_9CHLO